MTDMEEKDKKEEEENIIELTDIIKSDKESDEIPEPEETGAEELAEDILELTDSDDDEIGGDMEENGELYASEEETVLELTDVVEDDKSEDPAELYRNELTKTGGDFEKDSGQPQINIGGFDLDSKRIQAALENVIEKKYGSRIESVILKVMEKVIVKEINDIKETLQKDLNSIGKM